MRYRSTISAILGALALSLFAMDKSPAQADQPEEVGSVRWGRDFAAALEASAATKKPVFLLFQEVPGCAGCKKLSARQREKLKALE